MSHRLSRGGAWRLGQEEEGHRFRWRGAWECLLRLLRARVVGVEEEEGWLCRLLRRLGGRLLFLLLLILLRGDSVVGVLGRGTLHHLLPLLLPLSRQE